MRANLPKQRAGVRSGAARPRLARSLCLQTPGSAEAFYRGASEPVDADADPSGPVDFDRVRQSAERSGGMQLLGPPPFQAVSAG